MVMVCVVVLLVNHLDNKKAFRPLYIFKQCLKIILFCSFESVGLPLVKILRFKTQSLGNHLRSFTWNKS